MSRDRYTGTVVNIDYFINLINENQLAYTSNYFPEIARNGGEAISYIQTAPGFSLVATRELSHENSITYEVERLVSGSVDFAGAPEFSAWTVKRDIKCDHLLKTRGYGAGVEDAAVWENIGGIRHFPAGDRRTSVGALSTVPETWFADDSLYKLTVTNISPNDIAYSSTWALFETPRNRELDFLFIPQQITQEQYDFNRDIQKYYDRDTLIILSLSDAQKQRLFDILFNRWVKASYKEKYDLKYIRM